MAISPATQKSNLSEIKLQRVGRIPISSIRALLVQQWKKRDLRFTVLGSWCPVAYCRADILSYQNIDKVKVKTSLPHFLVLGIDENGFIYMY